MEGSGGQATLSPDPSVNSRAWLNDLLRQKCGVPSLYPHQLDHGKDLNDGRDLFLVIATGLGKSIVLFAPLIAAQARQERGIAFMIVPTKVLAEQQAEVGRKFGLRTIAINEDSVREAHIREERDLFAEFAGGNGISVGVMSPQMLQGRRVGKLLDDPKFRVLVRWMLIDEAHVLNEESGTFREPYRGILHMRPRLSTKTIWGATTGTATPSAALRIAAGLGFRVGQYVNARYTVDRPNVKYIPRFFAHPISGYEFMDFSFVVPIDMVSPLDIVLTLIFVKTIKTGYDLMKFLDSLIPLTVPNRLGIVKLYNSLMPVNYRRKFIADINDGSLVCIGIVTDTCTYGTDIPKLARVIVAHIGDGMGDSPEVRKQQMGRPGRDGNPAVAIVYAPAWVRDVPESQITTKQGLADLERRQQLPAVTREFFNPTPDCCSRGADLKYNGEEFVLWPDCCSLHDPEPESRDLAMVARWVEYFKAQEENNTTKQKTIRSDGTYKPLDAVLKASLTRILIQWRARKYNSIRDARSTGGGSVFILPDRLIQRIVDRAHACTSLDRLWGIMCDWKYLDKLGADLFEILTQVLPGYAEIINDRKEGTVPTTIDVDPPPSTPADPSDMDVDPPRVLRIVFPQRIVPPSPAKGPTKRSSPPSPPKSSRKRNKVSDPEKENIR
ncbi:P-loop containing nucleoside triphosphate hydrolase protein [Mycena albidolilacea]|uniref:DNA 3'-5' helicase n=1 Tax=Mycena albidolilacea TaxID=1033008 RepID=A0AAD6Z3A0_9AGAR|nr:P-loop containing nucleoside triphosphate hydrolase protein [Mycena albidolilacea]